MIYAPRARKPEAHLSAPWCARCDWAGARESDGSGRAAARERSERARGWSGQRDARKCEARRSGSPKYERLAYVYIVLFLGFKCYGKM
jgi:hypothetical protein